VLRKLVARSVRGIRHFGISGAVKVARELGKERRAAGTMSVWVRALGRCVTLRRGTSDAQVLWQVFAEREYEIGSTPHRDELRRRYDAVTAVGKRPVIVDCGANIGMTTLWFSRQFPLARIYAVEPEAGNFTVLAGNLAHLDNAVPVQAAIWPERATLRIVDADAPKWSFRVEQANAAEREGGIPAVTIDDTLKDAADSPILIVKIDIEGAEAALFESNTKWLDRSDMVVIELHDWLLPHAGTSRNFFKRLATLDCDVLVRGESLFVLRHAQPRPVVGAVGIEPTTPPV
jgi:FkbM family methyltransferase